MSHDLSIDVLCINVVYAIIIITFWPRLCPAPRFLLIQVRPRQRQLFLWPYPCRFVFLCIPRKEEIRFSSASSSTTLNLPLTNELAHLVQYPKTLDSISGLLSNFLYVHSQMPDNICSLACHPDELWPNLPRS